MATLRVRRAERALRGVRRGRVLDVGCGHYPFFLSRTAFDRRFGLDRERGPGWSELAAEQRVMLTIADIERTPRLPFADSSFDAVTMLAVVEHLKAETLAPLLLDVHRVLDNQGRIVVTTPPPWSDPVLRVMARRGLASRTEHDEHQTTYTPKRLRELLDRAGFVRARAGLFELGLNVWASGER